MVYYPGAGDTCWVHGELSRPTEQRNPATSYILCAVRVPAPRLRSTCPYSALAAARGMGSAPVGAGVNVMDRGVSLPAPSRESRPQSRSAASSSGGDHRVLPTAQIARPVSRGSDDVSFPKTIKRCELAYLG